MIGHEANSNALPAGWTMSMEEVSAGVYCLVARDRGGRTIRRAGTDPDALIEECRADIAELQRNLNGVPPSRSGGADQAARHRTVGGNSREFFALYDYGAGGLWVILCARSPEEIRHRYPMLQVFDGEPPMLAAADLAAIRRAGVQDIDDPPTGWLAELEPR